MLQCCGPCICVCMCVCMWIILRENENGHLTKKTSLNLIGAMIIIIIII